ncbi:hypothetical protein ACOME3_001838 [Neoechinorhynchus agilis]
MKRNKLVSSSRRKNRKRHFTAPSHIRYKLMSSPLSKELRKKFGIRSLPIHKEDEVLVTRGHFKSNQTAKVTQVYRKKFVVHLDRATREKANGMTVHVGIHPSNVVITKLKVDSRRKAIIDRKTQSKTAEKGKYTEEGIE